MSQMVTRKGPVGEDKEKRQTDSPVKDMKKKIAANAEKEKQAGDRAPEKTATDKNTDKLDKSIDKDKKSANDKNTDKLDRSIDKEKRDGKSVDKTDAKKDAKTAEKKDKVEAKSADKKDKVEVKSAEKTDKKDAKTSEKSDKKEKEKSAEKVEKKEKTEKKEKAEKTPEKKDRADKKEDKKDDVKERNGKADHAKEAKQNGARNGDHEVSSEDDELERDELFPELAYDDSDVELVEGVPSRSTTRRDQVKAARTPETPRPASDKRPDDESKEKALKLQDLATDRRLRSADSPAAAHEPDQEGDNEERRKPDTNYSRTRARVSPYRRAHDAPAAAHAASAAPAADVTACSAVADYTGNNTTMETDMEESLSSPAPGHSPYLTGLRTVRARRSYKQLRDLPPRSLAPRPARAAPALPSEPTRPTAPVVGRKRRPDDVELAVDALAAAPADKRPRLLQRLARPFRALAPARHAEIVGINTDLPMTAPVACADAFDPEVIKPDDSMDTVDQKDQRDQRDQPQLPAPAPASRLTTDKRCAIV